MINLILKTLIKLFSLMIKCVSQLEKLVPRKSQRDLKKKINSFYINIHQLQ